MMDFFKGFAKVVTGLAPILTAVAGLVFPGSTLAVGVAKAIPDLISSAEKAIGDGNGPIKKQYVMEGAEKLVEAMKEVSTGGQKETWEDIAPFASAITDGICSAVKAVNSDLIDDNFENMKMGG